MRAARCRMKERSPEKLNLTSADVEKSEASSYYTCPMHPQIHQDHSGECPICHMKLVKVTTSKEKQTTQAKSEDKRSSVMPSENQMQLIGIQKTTAEVMNLNLRIPISGRILSSSKAVFQIYEKDLSHVRTGFKFIGESSSLVDESIKGLISSIDSTVDPTSRTVRVVGSTVHLLKTESDLDMLDTDIESAKQMILERQS